MHIKKNTTLKRAAEKKEDKEQWNNLEILIGVKQKAVETECSLEWNGRSKPFKATGKRPSSCELQ